MGQKSKSCWFAKGGWFASIFLSSFFIGRGDESLEKSSVVRYCPQGGCAVDEVIQIFNAHSVRYLVFGGQAIRLEGMPRFTMDWDIFIPGKDLENIRLINELLGDELDLELAPLGAHGENLIQTYQTRWGIIQFHLFVAGISSFDEAEKRAVFHEDENGVNVKCVSTSDLIASKKAVLRPQDCIDIEFLEIKYSEDKVL